MIREDFNERTRAGMGWEKEISELEIQIKKQKMQHTHEFKESDSYESYSIFNDFMEWLTDFNLQNTIDDFFDLSLYSVFGITLKSKLIRVLFSVLSLFPCFNPESNIIN